MKRIYLSSILLFITVSIWAQAPQAINYQAVIRGSTGYLLYNNDVNVRISIQQDSIGGNVEYSENHATTTTVYGIVTLAIGQGTVITGAFESILWADYDHFINIEVDTTDGSNYYDMGTVQLLSVPYALESKHSSSLTLSDSLGNNYNVVVDTSGNLQVILIEENIWTTCGDVLIDSRDGQLYNTVQISAQCWMAENLNIGAMIVGSEYQQDNSIIEKYCYDNNESSCNEYGGLYLWDEMMQYVTTEGTQGICPLGWHLPSDDEWKILEGTVDSQYGVGDPEWDEWGYRGYDAGENLKSTGGWNSDGNGTDLYGFTALPSGHQLNSTFDLLGDNTFFWSSTEGNDWSAWDRDLYAIFAVVHRYSLNKSYGFSVRCLKDD